MVIQIALLVFPELALGLFRLRPGGCHAADPGRRRRRRSHSQIRCRRLLILAAVIMSAFLITANFTTVILVPAQIQPSSQANGRALAYLAHDYLGWSSARL